MAEQDDGRQLRWRFLDWRPARRAPIEAEPRPREQRPREQRPRDPRPREPRARLRAGFADLEEFVREVGGGRIGPPHLGRDGVTVPMRAHDGELYHLRIHAPRYLDVPPRCTFVDGQGRRVPAAWPAYHPASPFRPPCFICTPPTWEYYQHHPGGYHPELGTLVNTVATIYTALQAPSYRGRYAGEPGF
jgi:hypothetical protein